jgi:hypothetical protein
MGMNVWRITQVSVSIWVVLTWFFASINRLSDGVWNLRGSMLLAGTCALGFAALAIVISGAWFLTF